MKSLEVWGGIECTLNRVGDNYIDQCQKNGHYKRLSDLELFKDLGIKKLRYPCLWEQVAMDAPELYDWQAMDERLNQLRDCEISPIAGFLHHGSGPRYTNLLDPNFPELLATYAGRFAQRYSWIEDFTPINEILTTARFSCLYGFWFPHHKSDYSFLKALFIQCKATVLAMREIKKFIPTAKLIQPEDIGKCQSTQKLHYQRDFENHRRWLAFDILCGNFNNRHPLYGYVIKSGIEKKDIQWAQDNPYPPDILGVNHYLLSNRFLDDRLHLYPSEFHGGNGIDEYADVGVLDTGQGELPLPEEILKETWQRYHIPLVVTEVHARGYREEQMAWFYKIWNAALKAQVQGVDIHAITAWSLLGSFDWQSLCTKNDMFYEPGVFELDNQTGIPKPTGLSRLVKELATKAQTFCPIVEIKKDWPPKTKIIFAAKEGTFSPLKFEGRALYLDISNSELRKIFATTCAHRHLACDFNDYKNSWAKICLDDESQDQLKFSAFHFNKEINETLILNTHHKHFYRNPTKFVNSLIDLLIDGPQDKVYHFDGQNLNPLNNYASRRLCEN